VVPSLVVIVLIVMSPERVRRAVRFAGETAHHAVM
jgi:hypothetical protein